MGEIDERAVLARVWRRLIPLLFVLYVVNILDRVNVGAARLQMVPEVFGEEVYAFGAGIFYLGYLLFEVPSNLILSRTGARRWIARILMSWGLITCALMAVRGPWGFYALRMLLGFAEAGFFPGVILYLTYWFTARERARAVAYFMAASPVAGLLGNPLSGAILHFMDGVGGLRGWQWLFLLEGTPAVLLGFVVLCCLPDRPAQAGWLTPPERDWLAERVGREEQQRVRRHGLTLVGALADGRVWLLILLYVTVAAGTNGLGFYLQKLIETRFPGRGEFEIGLLAAVPPLCALLAMVLNGAHSDRTGERRWHVAVPAFLAATGWAASAVLDSPAAFLLALALAHAGMMSMLPVFWTLPTAFLSGLAAAGGIAWINSVGNLGGFIGPNILGQFQARTGSFTGGQLTLAGILCLGGVLALCVRHDRAGEAVTSG
jgi:ACS family tartrate transporter-like MFS transporter